jgi:hypothetical protein
LKLPTHLPDGESIASFLARVPRQKNPEKQALLDSLLDAVTATPPPKCYYCDLDEFKSRSQYIRHVLHNHNGKLAFPNLPYLKAMNLKLQGCLWEE